MARTWYEKEATEQTWAVRTLQRNIDSQYYYRLLSSQNTESVEAEMKKLTTGYQNDKYEYLKKPVVAEFLGLSSNIDMTETRLESAILSNLQKFLMELGKGYAFVARQQHIHTEKQDYYIDLVFYNYILHETWKGMLMRRTTSLCLALLMLAAVLSACGGTKPETPAQTIASDTTAEAAPETEYIDTYGEKDFKGAKYVIMDANDYPTNHRNQPFDEFSGEVLNEAIVERNSYIGDRYNCEIGYLSYEGAKNGCNAFSQSFTAGDKICDVIITTISDSGTLQKLHSQGMLANLEDIPTLELTNPWWSRLMYENIRLNGKMYFTTGDFSPSAYMGQCVTLMNMKLLSDYGYKVDDIYQLVRDGKYTLDRLLEFQEQAKDLDGDGFLHTGHDFFGYVGDSTGATLSACALAVGAGVSLSTLDGDKMTIDGMSSQHAVDVVEKLQKLVPHEKMDDRREYIKGAFKEDRAISCMTYISSAKEYLRDMESDFMILPMPKYDEAQREYRTLINGWCDCFIAIPADADAEFSGFLTEVTACRSYTTIRPCVYETLLKAKVARDEQTTEMIDIVFDSLCLDFNYVYNFGGTTAALGDSVYKDAPYASAIAAKKEAALKAIEEFVKNW